MSAPDARRRAQYPEAATTFVERLIERSLLVAIGASVALMLMGIVLALAAGQGLPDAVLSVYGLPQALMSREPAAYLTLGLLMLMATPFARVAGALAVFAMERDRRYALLTAAVLAVMCLGVLLGQV